MFNCCTTSDIDLRIKYTFFLFCNKEVCSVLTLFFNFRLKSPPSPLPQGDVQTDEAKGGDTLRKKKFSLRKLMKFGNKVLS